MVLQGKNTAWLKVELEFKLEWQELEFNELQLNR